MSATAWLPIGEGDAAAGGAGGGAAAPARRVVRLRAAGREGASRCAAVGRGRDLGGEVEILSGLAAGETVVVEGAFLLKAEAEKAEGEGGHHDH